MKELLQIKNGFCNLCLKKDLIRTGDLIFKGIHRTVGKYPVVCGPYRVPFLLNLPQAADAHRVTGELYSVTHRGLAHLDELEETIRCHYERLAIKVVPESAERTEDGKALAVVAEVYYAHRSYAVEMWKRNGKRGYEVYGEEEAICEEKR